jgi:hypothetical protein
LLSGEQLDIGAVAELFDSRVLLVGLAGMLAPWRHDQLIHTAGIALGFATLYQQANLGALGGDQHAMDDPDLP